MPCSVGESSLTSASSLFEVFFGGSGVFIRVLRDFACLQLPPAIAWKAARPIRINRQGRRRYYGVNRGGYPPSVSFALAGLRRIAPRLDRSKATNVIGIVLTSLLNEGNTLAQMCRSSLSNNLATSSPPH